MTLPLLVSVPHAGLRVPEDLAQLCRLSEREIAEDGDEGAGDIYAIEGEVRGFVTTEVARAIVDLNRAETDRRKDGIVKTHTCWDVPVWRTFPSEEAIELLLARSYRPYHRRLSEPPEGVLLGVDCHTMAAEAPPVAPDVGAVRPPLCLSDGEGTTCPPSWTSLMASCLAEAFEHEVRVNDPFKGGYICRSHAGELPWLQIEMSRAAFLSLEEKRVRLLAALDLFCRRVG